MPANSKKYIQSAILSKTSLKKEISSREHDNSYKKAEPCKTVKQGRSQGKLWLEHFFQIIYFNWTPLHLKFDQRTHSLINIGFLTSCLTFLITSTDIEGRRICLKNCDKSCCRLLIPNDHVDSDGLVICLYSPRYESIIMEQ